MIPKIIHYCWFGGNPLPKNSVKFIKRWQKLCPKYKIVCWSEKNFNCNKFKFTKIAYKYKDWAAISDYVRLIVLKKYGGIYLDTDVEMLKPLDPLLNNNSFIGMEDYGTIASGLIYGANPNDSNVKNLLDIYNNINLNDKNMSIKSKLNGQVQITTSYFHNIGYSYNNKKQIINGCTIYPTSYFCPERYGSSKINLTSNTYTIHHYFGSWTNGINKCQKRHIVESRIIRRIMGVSLYNYLYKNYLKIKQMLKK